MLLNIKNFCVYSHDINGNIIYIGAGTPSRPYSFCRPKRWRDLVLKNNFELEIKIIGWFSSKKEALIFEKEMIKKWKPICNLFHNEFKFGKETLERRSAAQKGHLCSSETRFKIGKANRGKRRSEEVIEKMRIRSTGKLHTEKTKEKIRIGNTGKKLKAETKKKIGDANRGNFPSKEVRLKISKALKGRAFSQEHRSKIGTANHRRNLIHLIDSQFTRFSHVPY